MVWWARFEVPESSYVGRTLAENTSTEVWEDLAQGGRLALPGSPRGSGLRPIKITALLVTGCKR